MTILKNKYIFIEETAIYEILCPKCCETVRLYKSVLKNSFQKLKKKDVPVIKCTHCYDESELSEELIARISGE